MMLLFIPILYYNHYYYYYCYLLLLFLLFIHYYYYDYSILLSICLLMCLFLVFLSFHHHPPHAIRWRGVQHAFQHADKERRKRILRFAFLLCVLLTARIHRYKYTYTHYINQLLFIFHITHLQTVCVPLPKCLIGLVVEPLVWSYEQPINKGRKGKDKKKQREIGHAGVQGRTKRELVMVR